MWSRQQRQVRSLSRATPRLSPPCTVRHRVRRLPVHRQPLWFRRRGTATSPFSRSSLLLRVGVEVRLAQRPNGATTWVPLRVMVSLSTTPYRMVLNLRTEHLVVFEEGREDLRIFQLGSARPKIRRSRAVRLRHNARRGAGPGVRTIRPGHLGPLRFPSRTGQTRAMPLSPSTVRSPPTTTLSSEGPGSRVSHGCIRLHDDDLSQLDVIPAGTPLDIVSGLT